MKAKLVLGTVALCGCAMVLSQFVTAAGSNPAAAPTEPARASADIGGVTLGEDSEGGIASVGADVIVGDLTGPSNWTTGGPNAGIVRYSFGTTSCNLGTVPLQWLDNSTLHPVISQNLFRYKNNRFEQVGQAWLKHGFCALQQNLCAACSPYCGGCCNHLGVGCSDPYTSTRNGTPSGLGPKSQVNAATAAFPWPFALPQSLSTGSNNNGQVHVKADDMNPALNAGALYYAEAMYIAKDDATAANDNNNASWRRVNVANNAGFTLTYNGATKRQEIALQVWKTSDNTVQLVFVDIPNDGRIYLASRVNNNGDGTWHYEYAAYNYNSDRSGQSFVVPISECVDVTNIGFHDVDYHSGDGYVIGTNYDGTDWASVRAGGLLSWSTQSFASNPNANALRWATLYNFRFDADAPPVAGGIVMDLFKAGTPSSITFDSQVPEVVKAPSCPEDVADNDLQVNVNDLLLVINTWGIPGGAGDCSPACGDGVVDVADLLAVINAWGSCN